MCLAVPAQVVSIEDEKTATIEVGGVAREVALDLLPETRVGDWVIVHVGFAIQRLDEEEARKTLDLLDEMERGMRPPGSGD